MNLNLLTQKNQIDQMVSQIKETILISGQSFLAIDTEFIRENTFYPILELIQVASSNGAWIIDARSFVRESRISELQSFFDLLQDPKITKIFHAAGGDQECLWSAFKITAKPSIDSAIAAALCGYGDHLGLANALKAVLDIQIKKGHARTNWSVRPLPDHLLEYAINDVIYMVDLGKTLSTQLKEMGRFEWAMDLSSKFEDPKMYDPPLEDLVLKVSKNHRLDQKTYGVLYELVSWRETRVKKLNIPRKWVAEDTILLDVANVKPRDIDHLGAFRGINRGEVKSQGAVLLEAIQRGQNQEYPTWPGRQKDHSKPVFSEAEDQAMGLLKAFMGILSDQHRISERYLFTVGQYPALIKSKVKSPEKWVELGVMSKPVFDLIGIELWEFLSGKRALSIKRNSEGDFSVEVVTAQ